MTGWWLSLRNGQFSHNYNLIFSILKGRRGHLQKGKLNYSRSPSSDEWIKSQNSFIPLGDGVRWPCKTFRLEFLSHCPRQLSEGKWGPGIWNLERVISAELELSRTQQDWRLRNTRPWTPPEFAQQPDGDSTGPQVRIFPITFKAVHSGPFIQSLNIYGGLTVGQAPLVKELTDS